jgi:hypothetical protein
MSPTRHLERVRNDAVLVHRDSDQANARISGRGPYPGIRQRFGENGVTRRRHRSKQIKERVLSSRADNEPITMCVGDTATEPPCSDVALGLARSCVPVSEKSGEPNLALDCGNRAREPALQVGVQRLRGKVH